MARYVRPGELHQSFNFEFLGAPWSGAEYRRVIDQSLSRWMLVVRHDRGCSPTMTWCGMLRGWRPGWWHRWRRRRGGRIRSLRGRRGRRVATSPGRGLLILALPGSAYLYQGEELGLPEVFDLPARTRQDPIFARTAGAQLGRDGCRVPLPWSRTAPAVRAVGPDGSQPWLPQPAAWADLSVAAQLGDPDSTLSL
jgi:alpha-glucosidase